MVMYSFIFWVFLIEQVACRETEIAYWFMHWAGLLLLDDGTVGSWINGEVRNT
jgi:hypothetical protein